MNYFFLHMEIAEQGPETVWSYRQTLSQISFSLSFTISVSGRFLCFSVLSEYRKYISSRMSRRRHHLLSVLMHLMGVAWHRGCWMEWLWSKNQRIILIATFCFGDTHTEHLCVSMSVNEVTAGVKHTESVQDAFLAHISQKWRENIWEESALSLIGRGRMP